jgi:DNA-binding FadR family transcriptional regulator
VFAAVRTRRTFEEAVEQIAEKVKLGELAVGDRLPSERDLAAQMQISRPTLREAIKVLVDAGLVTVRPGPGGGTFIATELVPPELVRRRSHLRVSEVAGVLEARRLLEPRVAQLAAARAGEEDFQAMRHTIAQQRELLSSGPALRHEDRFLQLDVQFHLAIARATSNATITSLMRSLFGELEIARDMAMHVPFVSDWAVEIHERTLAAIEAGDLEAIELVMDEHLGRLEQTWEQETGRALVRPSADFLFPNANAKSSRV